MIPAKNKQRLFRDFNTGLDFHLEDSTKIRNCGRKKPGKEQIEKDYEGDFYGDYERF
jgi:hypothetical protein